MAAVTAEKARYDKLKGALDTARAEYLAIRKGADSEQRLRAARSLDDARAAGGGRGVAPSPSKELLKQQLYDTQRALDCTLHAASAVLAASGQLDVREEEASPPRLPAGAETDDDDEGELVLRAHDGSPTGEKENEAATPPHELRLLRRVTAAGGVERSAGAAPSAPTLRGSLAPRG